MNVDFEPITPHTGAYVRVAAAEEVLSDGVAARILAALNTYGVLVFPEVHMSDETFVALTNALGQNQDLSVTADNSEASAKGIYRIALDKDDRTQLDYVWGNDFWHMDGTSYDTPGKSTLLKCEQPPSEGGDTEFANLFAAYDALPAERKAQLAGLRVVHCLRAVGRRIYYEPTAEDFARWARVFPPREHPLVWRQKDGRSSMLIGSTAEDIVGLHHAQGERLLEELLVWSTQDRFTYRHKWRKGDLVMFNNPGMLHRSHPYTEASGRVMHRTTLKGVEAIA